jgi:hypothetical protein
MFHVLSFYLVQFLSYENCLHWDSNLWQIYRVIAFAPVISSPKQTPLVLGHSSVLHSLQSTENIFIGNQTQVSSSTLWPSFLQSPVWDQLSSHSLSSTVLSSRTTATTLTRTRTKDTFSRFLPFYLFLLSWSKHVMFSANQFIHSQAISKHTHAYFSFTHSYTDTHMRAPARARAHTRTHTHVRTHTRTHAHTHTHRMRCKVFHRPLW